MKISGVKLSKALNAVKEFVDKPVVDTAIAVVVGLGLAIALNSCETKKQAEPDVNSLQALTEKFKRQADNIKKELECNS